MLDGVTLTGNQAIGGSRGTDVQNQNGGGLGEDAGPSRGGGFGGDAPGAGGGAGGAGARGDNGGGGGGGGGYSASDNGESAVSAAGGRGGGPADGLGGGSGGVLGGAGSGAGGSSSGSGPQFSGFEGGGFGIGGSSTTASGAGAGGAGGVGGGGGGGRFRGGGGGGGFGGGGGGGGVAGDADVTAGRGGFGGGGGGGAGGATGGFGGGAGDSGAGGAGGGMGGAVFNDGGTVSATNATMTANAAVGGSSSAPGGGGSAYGSSVFNLNGSVLLVHVTVTGDTLTAGTGATAGMAAGAVTTLGYAADADRVAQTRVFDSIVTSSSSEPLAVPRPATVADGRPNRGMGGVNTTPATLTSGADPQLAPLGDYGGPTRTLAPLPGSPAVGGATFGTADTDQRGLARSAPKDLGAVEVVATTVTTADLTIPFSGSDRVVSVGASVGPVRGETSPGSVTFTVEGLPGSASAPIAARSASVSGSFTIPAGTAPGAYRITGVAAAAPGFSEGSGSQGTLTVLPPPATCRDVAVTTSNGKPVTATPDCVGQSVTVIKVTDPSHGTASVVDGSLRYTPQASYAGTDSFTYAVENPGGRSNAATVSVTVKPPPVLTDTPSGQVVLGGTLTDTATVAGRSLPQASTVDFRLYGPDDASCSGTPVFTAAGRALPTATDTVDSGAFTPTAPGTYRWKVAYSGDANNAAQATGCGTPVRVLRAPAVCRDLSTITGSGAPVTLAADCDGRGAGAALVIVDRPAHGTARIADGQLVYAPDGGYAGTDTFTYALDDEGGRSNVARATIEVSSLPAECIVRGVELRGIRPAGTQRNPRVRLIGVAAKSFAGGRADILQDGERIGSALIRPDGTVRASVPQPRQRATSYQLRLDALQSSVLTVPSQARFARVETIKGGRVLVRGRLIGIRGRRTVIAKGVLFCGGQATPRAKVRTTRSGRFKLRFRRPAAGASVIYRITVKGRPAATFPLALTGA